jgi:hypothetical protein
LIVSHAEQLPAIHGAHEAWRYMLMSGVIPALPPVVVRPFLPESPIWREQQQAGTLRRPRLRELFTADLRQTTIVTTVIMAAGYAVAYGAIQQTPRMTPGLAEVRLLPSAMQERTISLVQTFHETGGLVGRMLLAFLAVRIVNRRRLLHLFQVPGLLVVPIVFAVAATTNLVSLRWGIFAVGIATVGQFSFWGNYLPRVYPTYLRGTGESFAANIGGRMIGTSAAIIATQLANALPGGSAATRLAYAAAIVGTSAYLIGLTASRWLPEPAHEALPD